MATDPCPGEARLRAFLLGEGHPAELETVGKHLEGCPECERLAQGLEPQVDTLVHNLRGASPSGPTSEQVRPDEGVHGTTSEAATRTLAGRSDPVAVPDRDGSTRVWDVGLPPPARGTIVGYFGDYEIRKVLGSGAMGLVYEARQVSLNRPVALKMIKAGIFADEGRLRRFQNEAEAVAQLDHPGIVPIYEVGSHEGQRYFSMKLVEGGNLAERIATFTDHPRAAAAIVSEIADAVHHAHMRGILHRDLKPANILVDPDGHPHVTDFGLAKTVEGDSDMTETGVILGTPAYMSPEQANGRRGTVTTASDVYGLGAVLYGLLTGKAPFGGEGVIETLDAVRTRPPESPRKLNGKVPRDLETICLKCLEKDARRRYPSADALANDLKAWLGARPIAARRVGIPERAWLWSKRRPAVAALAAGVMLAVSGGTAAVIVVQAKANADLRRSNDRVQDRFDLARRAIRAFQDGVNENDMLKGEELRSLRNKLLGGAAGFYVKLEELLQDQTDRPSRAILAQSYHELGELIDKIGIRSDALAIHRKALAIRRELNTGPGADANAKIELARTLNAIGGLAAATGDNVGALAALEEARDLTAPLAAGVNGSIEARDLLAHSYQGIESVQTETGRSEQALEARRESLKLLTKLAQDNPKVSKFRSSLAECLRGIGIRQIQAGQEGEAMGRFLEALKIHAQLVEDNPDVVEYRSRLAYHYFTIGKLEWRTGRTAEALVTYREALKRFTGLTEEYPAITEFRSNQAQGYLDIGSLLRLNGQTAEASEPLRQALTIQAKLAEDNPRVTRFSKDLAFTHNNIAVMQFQSGDTAGSLDSFHRALAIWARLARADPKATLFLSELAVCQNNIANLLLNTGHTLEALAKSEEARAINQSLVDSQPQDPEYRYQLASCLEDCGDALRALGRIEEARDRYVRCASLYDSLLVTNPSIMKYRRYLGYCLRRLAITKITAGEIPGAEVDARRADKLYSELDSRSGEDWYEQACARATLASLAGREGSSRPESEAGPEADRAMELLRRAVEGGYRNPASMRIETALDPLRPRLDFRLLMMDLDFPDRVFAR